MSVINKMLQDLDARQNGARGAADLYAKPAAYGERRMSPPVLAGAAVSVAAIAFGAAFAWRYWQQHRQQPASAPVPAKVVIVPAPPQIAPLPPASAPVAEAAASAAAPAASVPPMTMPAAEPVEQTKPAVAEPAEQATPAVAEVPRHAAHKRARGEDKRNAAKKSNPKRDKHVAKEAPERKAKAKSEVVAPTVKPTGQGKEETPSQKAEAAYRRSLASIQEGYVSDAIGQLEQALQANPHHDAARQTLVRVLIDNRRTDDAVRQLQLALTLDPRQPSMAMLLARLQIERGGTGIETLVRTLPYAGGNGEYHAFLAGALQRQQRNREAAEQYQLALRSLPQNGVWLMGLGISLQAEKRDAEALDAFRKAKNSATLTPELLSFVDGKIQQLAR
ncbi:MAG: tetratricopeptide repeat protein [Telluria sp.]